LFVRILTAHAFHPPCHASGLVMHERAPFSKMNCIITVLGHYYNFASILTFLIPIFRLKDPFLYRFPTFRKKYRKSIYQKTLGIRRACFSDVSQFWHTGNIVFSVNVCFQDANYASATRQRILTRIRTCEQFRIFASTSKRALI